MLTCGIRFPNGPDSQSSNNRQKISEPFFRIGRLSRRESIWNYQAITRCQKIEIRWFLKSIRLPKKLFWCGKSFVATKRFLWRVNLLLLQVTKTGITWNVMDRPQGQSWLSSGKRSRSWRGPMAWEVRQVGIRASFELQQLINIRKLHTFL